MTRIGIERLELRNFRQFTRLELSLAPELTVLVAENGRGKSAVLDALAVALRPFVATMLGSRASAGIVRTDVRRSLTPEGSMVPQLPTSIASDFRIAQGTASSYRELASLSGRTTTSTSNLLLVAGQLLHQLRDYADERAPVRPALPVIAYYGTGRLWHEGRISERKRAGSLSLNQPTDAYQECLSPTSNFRNVALWFEAMAREAQREQAGASSPHRPRAMLAAVRRATDHVLEPVGWRSLDWDFVAEEIVASHPDQGQLPVSLLSDGVRSVVALVADLAHRCARLNPHLGEDSPARTSGIVLIDEVDLHLHPSWQQAILHALRSAFPNVQFIVSTHSPQVLSTVDRSSIRVLSSQGRDSFALTPGQQTRGVESSDVLASVMGVDPAPDVPEWRALADYRAMIEDGAWDTDSGRALRADLDRHFGPSHPVMLDADRLIRFQAFKKRRGGPSPT